MFREGIQKDLREAEAANASCLQMVEQWRVDINAIAMAQSCTSEFLQM